MTWRYTKFIMVSGLVPAVLFLFILKFIYHFETNDVSITTIGIYYILLLTPICVTVSPWYRRFEQTRERKPTSQHD